MSRGRLASAFDRSGAVQRPPYRRLLREAWAHVTYFPAPPDPASLPQGGGHVVLVVPPFLNGDRATVTLRRFLERCGYRSYGWTMGVNIGPTPRAAEGLRARVARLRAIEGGPVSLVGISLGGVLARDVAYDLPDHIRHVITVASPFRLPTASTIEPLIHLCARFASPAIDVARLSSPLPVPATAFYSREDGLVAWDSCRGGDGRCIDIEIGGPHLTIRRNPALLRALAEALAPVRRPSP